MARGDVVSSISAAVASYGNLDYQPAVGVEARITHVFTTAQTSAGDLTIKLFNGTTETYLGTTTGTPIFGPFPGNITFHIMVNNTNYLRLTNNHAATKNLGYCGIQTK